MKIHRSVMAHSMVKSLSKRIKRVETWDVSVHVDNRMLEKSLSFDLLAIVSGGDLVEWHDEAGTERVVLEINNGKSRDSVVLDLTTEAIITVFSRENTAVGRNKNNYMLGG